jgi:acetyltransferase-like isoleucine patch superfamily enzyme
MNRSIRNSFIRRILGLTPSSADNWLRYRNYIDVHPLAIIAPSATIQISKLPKEPRIMLTIGENSHIYANFALTNENSSITIGSGCQIGTSSIIAATNLEIGNDVIVSWGCTFLDSNNHALKWSQREQDAALGRESYKQTKGTSISALHDWSNVSTEPIKIGSRSYIGMNVIVLKGVTVGEEAVIGAGSVVRNDLPPKSISIGNPSKITGYVK